MLSVARNVPVSPLCPTGVRFYEKMIYRLKLKLTPRERQVFEEEKVGRRLKKSMYYKGDNGPIKHWGRDPGMGEERRERLTTAFIDYHLRDSLLARTVSGLDERFIPQPDGVSEGDIMLVSRTCEVTPKLLKPGNRFPIGKLPIGTIVHYIELRPDCGACLHVRASGTSAQVVAHETNRNITIIKMPSGHLQEYNSECLATLGAVFRRHKLPKGKAGSPAKLGRRWPV